MQAMLEGTSHAPDEVVGRMRPTAFREFWEFTVEKVAVNAVMAGARPGVPAGDPGDDGRRHDGALKLHDLVRDRRHGQRADPQRDRHELRHRRVRAVQPRQRDDRPSVRACLTEPAGGLDARGDLHGLAGQLLGYSACFAENEERSPWTPFHVQHGFDASASTVTTFLGGWYTLFGTIRDDTWKERFARRAARLRSVQSGRSSPSIRSRPTSSSSMASTRARSSSTGWPRARCSRRASTGTTSGCRRSCARGRSSARSRSPAT